MTVIPRRYVIICPDCHGHMFTGGLHGPGGFLCPTCHGNGRLIIPERPQYRRTSGRAFAYTLLVAVLLLIGLAIAVSQ